MPNWLLVLLVLTAEAGLLWWVKPWLGEQAVQRVRQHFDQSLEVVRRSLDASARQQDKREQAVLNYLKVAQEHLWRLSLGLSSVDTFRSETTSAYANDLRASFWDCLMQQTVAMLHFDSVRDGPLLSAWKAFADALLHQTTDVHSNLNTLLRASRKLERRDRQFDMAIDHATKYKSVGLMDKAEASLAQAAELTASSDALFEDVKAAHDRANDIEPYFPGLMQLLQDFLDQVHATLHTPASLADAVRVGLEAARTSQR